MKIAGFLIIVIALVVTGWWVCTDHPHKGWAITVCTAALFGGFFLVVHDRAIEITLKGVGTIKAAAQQATIDAKEIADLRKRVEAQSATVDLVANSAREAHKIGDELSKKIEITDAKLGAVDEATRNAQAALRQMDRTVTFASVLLDAQSDGWEAFNQLFTWANDKTFPFHKVAGSAYVAILASYGGLIEPGFVHVPWAPGVNPSKLSLGELRKAYSTALPIYHAHIVQTVWGRSDFAKKERMEFLVHVLQTSNSMSAKYHAGKLFVDAAGDKDLTWRPFRVPWRMEPLLEWWETHKNSIQ